MEGEDTEANENERALEYGYCTFAPSPTGLTKLEHREATKLAASRYFQRLSKLMGEAGNILNHYATDFSTVGYGVAKLKSVSIKDKSALFEIWGRVVGRVKQDNEDVLIEFGEGERVKATVNGALAFNSLDAIVENTGLPPQYLLGIRDALRCQQRQGEDRFENIEEKFRAVEMLARQKRKYESEIEELERTTRHARLAAARGMASDGDAAAIGIPKATEVILSADGSLLGQIYFLVSDGVIVYVGQTCGDCRSRVMKHYRDKSFDRVFSMECLASDLNYTERALIKKFKPKYNVTHNTEATAKG